MYNLLVFITGISTIATIVFIVMYFVKRQKDPQRGRMYALYAWICVALFLLSGWGSSMTPEGKQEAKSEARESSITKMEDAKRASLKKVQAASKSSGKNKQSSLKLAESRSSSAKKVAASSNKKAIEKEESKAYQQSLNAYCRNTGKALKANYDGAGVEFTVKDSVDNYSSLGKAALVKKLILHANLLANLSDVPQPPILVYTASGSPIARTTLTGKIKIY